MLVELRVRDLAVISDARLELGPGLNVLTGETGAGKSMLVDALSLLLGERAESDLVRPGAAKAVVEGAFDFSIPRSPGPPIPRLSAALDRLGIDLEDDRLVLKREVHAAGRSRAWINGSPVSAGVLGEIGALLVDLHGQHETQSLLGAEAQRDILDAFADAEARAAAVAQAWEARETLVAERRDLEARQGEARKRADYLRHVADEIAKAAPKDGERDRLEGDVKRLTHAEELGRTAGELVEHLEGDDRAAGNVLGQAGRLLQALERIDDAGTAGWREMLETAVVNIEELARAVREYAAGVEADPARLASLERRRDVLFRLEQKYGPGLGRVRQAGEEAARELELLDTAGADLAGLTSRIAEADAAFGERCRALSKQRRAASTKLGAAASKHLASLGMPDGKLVVALDALETPGRTGAESVAFLVSLNPGMGERPLARAASGGELSRVMLALKVELARHDAVPTLVFDEVDQGVGGHVAGKVADALASVAGDHQVLVITHLPQIAAAAARQLVVVKDAAGGKAATHVRLVEGDERQEEIARMLGGASETARRHAAELLGK